MTALVELSMLLTGYLRSIEAQTMEGQQLLVPCTGCGGNPRNHHILKEYADHWEVEEAGIAGASIYQICKCAGCDEIRFRIESHHSEDIDDDSGKRVAYEKVYPEAKEESRPLIETVDLPDPVARIYKDTVIAKDAGAMILAGGGLRAIVEALCQDKEVPGSNLQDKIDNLARQGYLATPQADLLHEERYLGNAALHEIVAPSRQDLQDGFDIIETLLATIYLLPDKARRLQQKRTRQASP